MTTNPHHRRHYPLLITCTYASLGIIWILLSRLIVPEAYHTQLTILFVVVLGLSLLGVLRWAFSEVQDSQDQLLSFIETVPLAIIGTDAYGKVLLWNNGATATFGWTKDEVLGAPVPFVSSEMEAEYQRNRSRIRSGESINGVEVRRRRKDGSLVDLKVYATPPLARSSPIHHVAVAADITAQRQADQALIRYRMLAQSTQEIVLFFRDDGRIIEANQAALQAYGYTQQEILQLSMADLRAPEEGAEVPPAWRNDQGLETLHRRRDGRLFPVEISSYGMELGNEYVYMCIMRDVSLRKQRETAIRLLNEADHRILQDHPLDSVLQSITVGMSRLFDIALVYIALVEQPDQLRIRAVSGVGAEVLHDRLLSWENPDDQYRPALRSVRFGQLQAGKISEQAQSPEWMSIAAQFGLRSYLAIPLTGNGRVIGSLTLYDTDPAAFSADRTARFQGFASQLSLSILTAQIQGAKRIQATAMQMAAHAIVITDRNGLVEWINPAFTQMTGYTEADIVGKNLAICRSGKHPDSFYTLLRETLLAGHVWRGELESRRKDGSLYTEEQTISPIHANGEITHFICIKLDVSDRKRHEEQMRRLAMHDALTGLPNRQALEQHLEVAVKRGEQGHHSALLVADVDNFKLINDTLGHPVGDSLLTVVAQRLQRLTRPGDMVARTGPDEFAILADGVTPDEARELAESMRQAVSSAPLLAEEHQLDPTVSVGVVPVTGRAQREEVLFLAESTLEEARAQGINRVIACQTEQANGTTSSEVARMALYLTEALRHNHFVLLYQPVVRLGVGQTDHYEALLRLRGPDGKLLTPGTFLPAAERYRMMPEIDRWVVHNVLNELERRPHLHCFVNLAGHSLGDDALLTYIEDQVKACPPGVASRLTLELTETTAVRDLLRAQQWMQRLTELGCQFALDDFGMGFSSFTYLRTLPVRYVKIDGSFIRNLQEDPTNRALVQAISTVAHTLNKLVIAEWVENEVTAQILYEMGVEFGQGFGLGPPDRLPQL